MAFWPDICETVASRERDFVLGYEDETGWYISGREFLNQYWDIPYHGWVGFYEDLRGREHTILMRKGMMRW